MRFLIDEQLPALLVDILSAKGYEAVHVNSLSAGKHVSDAEIIQRSIDESYVVITKDVDFLNNFLIKNQPKKLVYVVTGNIKNRELFTLFR